MEWMSSEQRGEYVKSQNENVSNSSEFEAQRESNVGVVLMFNVHPRATNTSAKCDANHNSKAGEHDVHQ